uniref:Chalcone synthase n=1 Tax=Asparagus officinalis TaxID=4686 RepID=A0A2Z6FCE8_ASPOF|nr:chalcone synthase [Asparagus officinalis]BBE25130.1 chalcone synthase [Asparagus officinalis]
MGSMGKAAVLAIGTANPPTEVDQSQLPDLHFKATNSEHMVDLKHKFGRICKSSQIDKRYTYVTESLLQQIPSMATYDSPSLNARQDLLDVLIPALAAEASRKAIADWGQPISSITHLVVCNSSGASMPGADYELVKLLGLPLSTKRFMLYQQGCFGGGSVLRLAKDLAENNGGARVLVVCSEPIVNGFRGPCEDHIQNLVVQVLFGDGAAAVVVGADPRPGVETPLFEIVSTYQNIIAGSEGTIEGKLREAGLMISLQPEIPLHIAGSIGKIVKEALEPIKLTPTATDRSVTPPEILSKLPEGYDEIVKEAMGSIGSTAVNDVFWIVHPGGRAIMDAVEMVLGLNKEKLEATREVLREYGNMSSASVLFVMETMRRRSEKMKMATAGEGLEWGLLIGMGPGITVETVVLRCP